jgi:hypothetical protein
MSKKPTKFLERPTLGFDPSRIVDPVMREIFDDDTARTMWLALRQHRLVSQDFNRSVLKAAEWFDEKGEHSLERLTQALIRPPFGDEWFGSYEDAAKFAAELMPYVLKKQHMGFTYHPRGE